MRLTRLLLLGCLFTLGQTVYADTYLFEDLWSDVKEDYQHYYTPSHWRGPALLLGAGAVFANTGIDKGVRKHWQADIRGGFSDDISDLGESIGGAPQLGLMLPMYLGAHWMGRTFEENSWGNYLDDWGSRAFRITAIIAPQQAILTKVLGAGRPEQGDSDWNFFEKDRAISGHATYGAIPFLSAASLAQSRWAYGFWMSLSVLPALSRVNDDKHYFSQSTLGWGLSYLATLNLDRDPNDTEWAIGNIQRFAVLTATKRLP